MGSVSRWRHIFGYSIRAVWLAEPTNCALLAAGKRSTVCRTSDPDQITEVPPSPTPAPQRRHVFPELGFPSVRDYLGY